MGGLVQSRGHDWTHRRAIQIHQSALCAAMLSGACGLYCGLLNLRAVSSSKMDVAELMGKQFKYIRVLFTLWRGWVLWNRRVRTELMGTLVK